MNSRVREDRERVFTRPWAWAHGMHPRTGMRPGAKRASAIRPRQMKKEEADV
jgi:hypothetical protein